VGSADTNQQQKRGQNEIWAAECSR